MRIKYVCEITTVILTIFVGKEMIGLIDTCNLRVSNWVPQLKYQIKFFTNANCTCK